MRETRTYGSVRGASSNGRPYRDPDIVPDRHAQALEFDVLFSGIVAAEYRFDGARGITDGVFQRLHVGAQKCLHGIGLCLSEVGGNHMASP